MDRQNRVGSRAGGGGVQSSQDAGVSRRERLRKLAMEAIDLNKDPYFMRNHVGMYECRLCGTMHRNEGSYLAHTQARRHQTNLARRAAREARDKGGAENPLVRKVAVKKTTKIGRPGFKVVKRTDPVSGQRGLLFELEYPDIATGVQPRHRFMSAFEQRVGPQDPEHQYLLFAGEPYETVGFRVPSQPLDQSDGRFRTAWDPESRRFTLELYFQTSEQQEQARATEAKMAATSSHRPQIQFKAF